jgi:hypothetical protein
MIVGGGSCPLLQLYPDILLTTEKKQDTSCVDLAAFLGAASSGLLSTSPSQLPVGDFRLPMVGTSAFQVAKLRGFPATANSVSKLCQRSDVVGKE